MENTKDINWADVEKELRKILKKNAQARKRATSGLHGSCALITKRRLCNYRSIFTKTAETCTTARRMTGNENNLKTRITCPHAVSLTVLLLRQLSLLPYAAAPLPDQPTLVAIP